MGQTGNYSGQFWKLTPLGDGAYRLTNSYLGTSRAPDTYSDTDNRPFMGKTDHDYSGQHRKLSPLGDGTYRLTNAYLGTSRALDTYSGADNRPFMGKRDQDYSGQHWTITKVDFNQWISIWLHRPNNQPALEPRGLAQASRESRFA